MSVKSLCVRNRNCRTALHLVSVHGVGVPAHKGVARSSGGRQSAICTVISNGLACSAYATAVCIEAYGVSVRRPMSIEGVVVCGLKFRAFRHFRSATCRGIPTRKGIARSGWGRQSAVGAVISNGFACSAYATAVCIEVYGVCIRLPFGNKVFVACAFP